MLIVKPLKSSNFGLRKDLTIYLVFNPFCYMKEVWKILIKLIKRDLEWNGNKKLKKKEDSKKKKRREKKNKEDY